jgi:hypothetical protein
LLAALPTADFARCALTRAHLILWRPIVLMISHLMPDLLS